MARDAQPARGAARARRRHAEAGARVAAGALAIIMQGCLGCLDGAAEEDQQLGHGAQLVGVERAHLGAVGTAAPVTQLHVVGVALGSLLDRMERLLRVGVVGEVALVQRRGVVRVEQVQREGEHGDDLEAGRVEDRDRVEVEADAAHVEARLLGPGEVGLRPLWPEPRRATLGLDVEALQLGLQLGLDRLEERGHVLVVEVLLGVVEHDLWHGVIADAQEWWW